jgi:hypothetical protein
MNSDRLGASDDGPERGKCDGGGDDANPAGKATSQQAKAEDGIDTFVFRDGQIRVQTVRYTLTPVG